MNARLNSIDLSIVKQFRKWGSQSPNILPVSGFEKRPGTIAHPITWTPYKTTPMTSEQEKKLFRKGDPFDALGIVSGINGWRCFDFDACLSTEAVFELLDALGLPENYEWTVKTGSQKGFHVWFVCDSLPTSHNLPGKKGDTGVFTGKGNGFDHLELRWERCQTLVPPSIHKSGNRYEFLFVESVPENLPAKVRGDRVVEAFHRVTLKEQQAQPKPTRAKPAKSTHDDEWQALKEAVTPEQVFDAIGWSYKTESGNHIGECPLHSSVSGTPLRWSLDGDFFKCFHAGCHAGGDLIEFVKLFRGGTALDAARWMTDRFAPELLPKFQPAARPPHPADMPEAFAIPEAPKQPAAPEQPPAQQNTPNPKKQPTAKEVKPAPGVYCVTELEKVLNPLEQEGIREKLLDMRDPVFDLRKQYPYFYEYCHDLNPVTDAKPQALVTALLPALACNVGNRAYIQAFGAKHFCNIWAVNIARSTIGRKTTSLNMPLKPIHEFEKELHTAYAQKMKDFEAGRGDQPNPKEYLIYPNATSEAFFDVLQDNPNGLMMFSEIASFLSSMSKSYMADFKATITDFFDTPEIRSRRTRGTGETVVRRPCFSISAATTKDWLLSELNKDSQNDVHSGFLQRFLLCNSYDVDVNALNFEFTKGGAELTAVHKILAGLFHGLRHVATSAEPVELELSEEAARMFSAVNKAIFTELVNKGNETLLSYAGRIFTGYFLRFCILFTLCDHVFDCLSEQRAFDVFNKGETVVNSKNAGYALALCEYYFRCAQAFILGEVEKTEEARHEKQIVRIMMRHYEQTGKEVISRAILMQRAHLNRKDLDTALENLIDQGVIVQLNEDSRNGKGKIYYRIVV